MYIIINDTQLYLPMKMGHNSAMQSLFDCFSDIKDWMSANFLHLNESKTEVIVFGPPSSTEHVINKLGLFKSKEHNQPKILRVIFDVELKSDKHINSVVRGGFFLLRNIAKLKPFLSFKNLEVVMHAFITSRLDYCNLLYLSISHALLLSRLQLVHKASNWDKEVCNIKKYNSIPSLASSQI